jgi:tripartite-type tricarboxylate transporter receptor subunit TctC
MFFSKPHLRKHNKGTSMVYQYRRAMTVLFAMILSMPAFAQAPDHRIVIIVPFAAGGAADKVARTVAKRWSENTGATILVDNKTGGSGIIAADFVAKAKPDGRTILLDQSSMLLHTFMRDKVPFNPADFVPLTKLVVLPHVLVVNAQLPFTTAAEFLTAARANPNKFNFSTPGTGSSQQLVFEQFARGAGIKLQHVPYKGGAPAVLAVATGEVELSSVTLSTALPQIAGGKVRAIAVDTPERLTALPNVPTFGELGIKEISRAWFGTFLPPGTPAAVVKQLNEGIVRALKDPSVADVLRKDGFLIGANTSQEFAAENVLDTKSGEKLVRELNIRTD